MRMKNRKTKKMKRISLLIAIFSFFIFCIVNVPSANYYYLATSTMLSPSSEQTIGIDGTFAMQCRGTAGTSKQGTSFNWDAHLQYNKTSAPSMTDIPTGGSVDLVADGVNPDVLTATGTRSGSLDFSSHTVTGKTADEYWVRCAIYDNALSSWFYSSTIKVTVTIDYPVFSVMSVNETIIGKNKYARFNVSVIDPTTGISYANGTVNTASQKFTAGDVDGNNNGEYYYDWKCTASDGTVDLTYVGANDTANNWNSTDTGDGWAAPSVECDFNEPFVGNATGNESNMLQNEWICLNATTDDEETNLKTVWAEVWNGATYTNYTMTDTGSTSCDVGSGDGLYGVEIQTTTAGYWNYTRVYANDSAGNLNSTFIDWRFNVTAVNQAPEITNIMVDDDNLFPVQEIDLTAASNRTVLCNGTAYDADDGAEISSLSATLYDFLSSTSEASDDMNNHYTNSTCWLSTADGNNKYFKCYFSVAYFANNATWECNATVSDTSSEIGTNLTNASINELLALQVPDTIDYSSLLPGETSLINKTNVTNAGNVQIDVKIYGYANNVSTSDNSLNCSNAQFNSNITLNYEQYNVTDPQCANVNYNSNMVPLTNLTHEQTWSSFNLAQRTSETDPISKYTCWALYIPTGVRGTCRGVVSFTAVKG